MHSVRILVRSPKCDLWRSWVASVTSDLSKVSDLNVGGVSDGCMGDNVIKEDSPTWQRAGWGFPMRVSPAGNFPPSHFRAQTYVVLYVKFPLLLFDLNSNWKVSTTFRKATQYQISWKSVQQFSSFYMRSDRHGEVGRRILAKFRCERAKNEILGCQGERLDCGLVVMMSCTLVRGYQYFRRTYPSYAEPSRPQ
jgi:hypothetical protein